MTSTNTEVLHRHTESWIVIQFTNVISHQSHSPCSLCFCLYFPLRCSNTFTRLYKDSLVCILLEALNLYLMGAHLLPIILYGKFKPNRTYPRSGWEEKVHMQVPEEGHGKKTEGFLKSFKRKQDVDWGGQGILEVNRGEWNPRASPTQSTLSALMVANKSVRGDWQGAGCKLTFFTSLYLFSSLSFSVACSYYLCSHFMTAEESLHKSSGIKEIQLWVTSKLNITLHCIYLADAFMQSDLQ